MPPESTNNSKPNQKVGFCFCDTVCDGLWFATATAILRPPKMKWDLHRVLMTHVERWLWHQVKFSSHLKTPLFVIYCKKPSGWEGLQLHYKNSFYHFYEKYIFSLYIQDISHLANLSANQEKTSRFTFSCASHPSLFCKIAHGGVLCVTWIHLQNCRRPFGEVQNAVNQWGWRHSVGLFNCFLQTIKVKLKNFCRSFKYLYIIYIFIFFWHECL